jgi:hypothetical protein
MDDDRRDGVCGCLDVYTGVKNMNQNTNQLNLTTDNENVVLGKSQYKKKQSIASLLAMDEVADIEFETVRLKDLVKPINF